MGRKKRNEMSGIFDFWKKPKKPEEQRSLYALPAPTTKPDPLAILRPKPQEMRPVEEKRTPWDILRPKAKSQELTPSEKKEGFLSIFKSEPKKEEEEQGPGFFSIFKAPPPQELVSPEEEARRMEDVIAPLRPTAQEPPPAPATRYVFIQPSAPPQKAPRPYGLPAPAPKPVKEWTFPTVMELANFFQKNMNLEGMWNMIRDIREIPEYAQDQARFYRKGIPMVIPVDPVVYQEFYTDFANFYGIPWSLVAEYLNVPADRLKEADEALWNNVFSPLNAMVPEAFELLKPADLPGFFTVHYKIPRKARKKQDEQKPWEIPDDESQSGGEPQDVTAREYWLYYIEPLMVPPALPGGGSGA